MNNSYGKKRASAVTLFLEEPHKASQSPTNPLSQPPRQKSVVTSFLLLCPGVDGFIILFQAAYPLIPGHQYWSTEISQRP
ncbi:hypothetical protein L1887_20911 [Cichorium endivia]|nr:hypothetical protein L1887_20911 [Cichorium endivia]